MKITDEDIKELQDFIRENLLIVFIGLVSVAMLLKTAVRYIYQMLN